MISGAAHRTGGWWRRGARNGLPAGSRRSRLAAVIVVSALAVSAGVLGSAAAASASVTAQPVAGMHSVSGVACPSGIACVAFGNNNSDQGVVVPVTNGIPGSAVAVPGTDGINAVACSSTTSCVAVGDDPTGSEGVVVTITNGTPGIAQAVPGTLYLQGVACAAAGTCVAVGANDSTGGVMVPITNGTPGAAQPVAGPYDLDAVACATATTCEAVGEGVSAGVAGVVVPITSGTPGTAQAVPGTVGLSGVACPTASSCEAVGTNSLSQGVVVPITSGTPGTAQAVSGSGGGLAGVACPTATTCEAVGGGGPGGVGGVAVTIINGTPGTAQAVAGTSFLAGVACPGGIACVAVGGNSSFPSVVAAVAIQTPVVSLTFDNGAISQYTLGYQHALQPQGVKATFYVNTGVMGGANHLSWSQLSALQSAGQEIGGKTVDGTNLTTLTTSQQISEICNDRQALTSHGLNPAGFAYPGGGFNATIESEVQGCGYNNARTAGSLSAAGPRYAETLPPKDWLALRAYAPTGQVTLAKLEALVTGAAANGGGWDPVVIQKVCSQALDPNHYAACTSSSGWIELADLNSFLSWVHNAGKPGGAPAGTVFSPIGATATSLGNPPS